MRGLPETITVRMSANGDHLVLETEEYHPVDRAAFQHESGFTAIAADGTEYFISEWGGSVWMQPENVEVGIAPEIKKRSDEIEMQMGGM